MPESAVIIGGEEADEEDHYGRIVEVIDITNEGRGGVTGGGPGGGGSFGGGGGSVAIGPLSNPGKPDNEGE